MATENETFQNITIFAWLCPWFVSLSKSINVLFCYISIVTVVLFLIIHSVVHSYGWCSCDEFSLIVIMWGRARWNKKDEVFQRFRKPCPHISICPYASPHVFLFVCEVLFVKVSCDSFSVDVSSGLTNFLQGMLIASVTLHYTGKIFIIIATVITGFPQ